MTLSNEIMSSTVHRDLLAPVKMRRRKLGKECSRVVELIVDLSKTAPFRARHLGIISHEVIGHFLFMAPVHWQWWELNPHSLCYKKEVAL